MFLLTRVGLAHILWEKADIADSDQTPHNAVSDHGIHCQITECLIKY